MCGILGVIDNKNLTEESLKRMRDTMIHRGPDDAGTWINHTGNVALAHRRLSIIDLSEYGRQPMSDRDGKLWISYNGEIYNFHAIRQELEECGCRFKSHSDTEVIINAYKEWGTSCLQKFNGMFAFALYDTEKKKMFIARDRAGEKPLYYYISDSTFICASEIKAIVQSPGFKKEINHAALIDYVVYGYIPAPKSIWNKIYKLKPAHFIVIDSETLEYSSHKYWDLDFTSKVDTAQQDAVNTINELLGESVKIRLVADVPVGALLSGGIDSSAVTAYASQYLKSLNTFTMGFEEKKWDERIYARKIAKRYNTYHTEETINAGDVNEIFDRLLWFYDEPFNDYSNIPTYYVCKNAAKHVKVCLTGDGGDELFCGYSKYQRFHLFSNLFKHVSGDTRKKLFSTLACYIPGNSKLRKQVSRLGLPVNELIYDLVSTSIKAYLDDVLTPDIYSRVSGYNPISVIDDYLNDDKVRRWDIINQARYVDFKVWLADMMLVKTDRASMANSLELRPPMLDYRFAELAASLPVTFLVNRSGGKKILKKALENMVPREILYRNKMGFIAPLEQWYKSGLQGRIKAICDNNPVLINKKYFLSLYNQYINRAGRFVSQLNNLIVLENWARKWL